MSSQSKVVCDKSVKQEECLTKAIRVSKILIGVDDIITINNYPHHANAIELYEKNEKFPKEIRF
jgi:hypothetical protein